MKQKSLFAMPPTTTPFKIVSGRRKSRRPLSSKHPIHLILKSAKSDLKKNQREILALWQKFAVRFALKTDRLVIVGNHIHAIVRLHSQVMYRRFVRALAGTLAVKFKIKWHLRPVTRVVSWGRDLLRLKKYLKLNWLEANQWVAYRPRRTRDLPGWLERLLETS